jgi:hypothetical protein
MRMKLRIWCDSGANIHSCREVESSTEELGYTDEEWAALSEEERESAAKTIAWENLDWGYEELPD